MLRLLAPIVMLICLFICASSTTAFAQSAPDVKDWNVLVYLNGVNSLDEFGAMNINQMEQSGSTDKMNVLVQWGTLKKLAVDRLLIQKDSDTQNVTSPVVDSLATADMGSPQTLVDFVRWAQSTYPSKKTLLIVWNHGGGWHLTSHDNLGAIHPTDISIDERTGHIITTEQLGASMKEIAGVLGHKLDIYASDACLMGMVEVAREMKDSVQYFVGSQEVEPGEGWPYAEILGAWQTDMSASTADVTKLIVKNYVASYNAGSNGSQGASMAAYDLSFSDQVDSAFSTLAKEWMSLTSEVRVSVQTAVAKAKGYTYDDYKDAIDLLDVTSAVQLAPTGNSTVRTAISNYVIANESNLGATTHGVSVWMPSTKDEAATYLARYRGLQFSQATGWGELVAQMYGL